MSETAATIVVTVLDAAAADNQPIIFLDDHLNVDTDGKVKTSFQPSDRAYILLQIPDGVTVDDVRSSDGSLSRLGQVTREQTDQLTIDSDTKTVSLSRIPAGGITASWYGNSGAVNLHGRQLTVTGDLPAIVDLTYSYRAISYVLAGPKVELEPDETWPVRVTAYTPERSTQDADNCSA